MKDGGGEVLAFMFFVFLAITALLLIDWDIKTNPPNQPTIYRYGEIDRRNEFVWGNK